MRTVRIDYVVVPVWLEKTTVGLKVALVGGDAIRAIEYSEKIRQQVDQHSIRRLPARERGEARYANGSAIQVAHWTRNDSGDETSEQETTSDIPPLAWNFP
jgi:hypothetical protein